MNYSYLAVQFIALKMNSTNSTLLGSTDSTEESYLLNGPVLGLAIGAIPTTFMILCLFITSKVTMNKNLEACFQNFAAGLIIAATASELFPLMTENVTQSESSGGIAIGFVFGLLVIYGVDYVVDKIENSDGDGEGHDGHSHGGDKPNPDAVALTPMKTKTVVSYVGDEADSKKQHKENEGDWEEGELEKSLEAANNPEHKKHVMEHIKELLDSINLLQKNSINVLDASLSVAETEKIAEKCDEEIHKLQYLLDHCRRLLEGSELELKGKVKPQMSEEEKHKLVSRLSNLKSTADHIFLHMQCDENMDLPLLKEMREHMDDMGRQVCFHFLNTFQFMYPTFLVLSDRHVPRVHRAGGQPLAPKNGFPRSRRGQHCTFELRRAMLHGRPCGRLPDGRGCSPGPRGWGGSGVCHHGRDGFSRSGLRH
jgi:hypothetical protein